jgi:hypothetical protein
MFRSSSKKKEKEAAGLSPKISAKLDLGSESDPKTPTSSILGGEVKVPTALRAGSHGSSMEVKLGGGGSSSSYSSSSGRSALQLPQAQAPALPSLHSLSLFQEEEEEGALRVG